MGARIAIAGELWSTNLGDPLIHTCLADLLGQAGAGSVVPIDLEDRQGFPVADSAPGGRRRLPPVVRTAAWWLLRRGRRSAAWRRQLEGCDALLIGGGQLIDDMDMLFPPRLAALADTAHRLGIPVAIAGCGVGQRWTSLGRRLLDRRLGRVLRSVLVRDDTSAASLARTFPQWPAATSAPDPAVWAGRLLGPAAATAKGAVIGLSIARLDGLDDDGSRAWWRQLIGHLAGAGRSCGLFTNGAPEDEALLRQLDDLAEAAPRPRSPAVLVATVAGYRCVASPRLHAAITAFSLGIPALSLSRQGKFCGFWDGVRVPGRAMGVASPVESAAAIMALADGQGDPPGLLDRARSQVAEAVGRLLAATVA